LGNSPIVLSPSYALRTGAIVLSHPLALIIEDNQDQAEILAMALQAAGFETEIIQDGHEALRRLEAIVPDLVILDMYLPRVSGTGILLQIRADPRLAGTWVIVVTVEPELADLLQDMADRVLVKPVDFAELRDIAARLYPATSSGTL
jgi:DNA-binding response OmpR family regulator